MIPLSFLGASLAAGAVSGWACTRPECQTAGGCAHRGPRGEPCYWPPLPLWPLPISPIQGCICPPTAERTCGNPACPRNPPPPATV